LGRVIITKTDKTDEFKKKRKGKRFIHPENVKHQKPLTKKTSTQELSIFNA
jgi:hypothetical protein